MNTDRGDHGVVAVGAGRRLISRAIRRRRGLVAAGVVAAIGYQGAFLVIPLVTGLAVDDVLVGGRHERLPDYLAILVGVAVVRAASGGLRKYLAGRIGASIGADLRVRLYEHIQRQSFSFHDRLGTGELMSRASSDITAVEQAVMMLPFGVQSMLLGLGGAALMFMLDPLLATMVVAIVVAVSVVPVRLGRPIREAARGFQDLVGELADYLEQQIHGIEVVKGHGFEDAHVAEGRVLAGRIRDAGVGLTDLRAAFQTGFGLAPSLAVVAVIGVGGWRGVQGDITAGELFAFIQYLGMLMAPVLVLAQALGTVPQGVAAGDRIAEVLASEPEIRSPQGARALPPGGGHVRYRDVTFAYRPGPPLLEHIDLDIQPGSALALVGASGSGKSTLALLLPRFYDVWSGSVELDGVSVEGLRLSQLRSAVAMVFEDTVILNTTVRHNLAMARPTAEPEEIEHAARLAQAHRFIAELPDGYDTVVGEDGVGLSGGQRQRLSIARAILRDPRVLILDDATSAVDPATDQEIRLGLAEVMRDRTTIIIAHRLETLALADRVVLIDGGRIVADGAHEDLLDVPAYRAALALDEPGVATGEPPAGGRAAS